MALENDWVAIEIADTGIGIDNKALSGIFTFFSQKNRSIAGREGLGLGLPLAKGIIKLHTVEYALIVRDWIEGQN